MILEEIATYIAAQSTDFAVAPTTTARTPLYGSKIPDNAPNTCVGIYESGGAGPTYTYSGVAFERPSAQLLCRSTSYTTARDTAATIWSILAPVDNASLSIPGSTLTTTYITITPVQSPIDIGEDSLGRRLISMNFTIEKELSPA